MIQTLVTGGTGFIGFAVVRTLRRGNESVRVLSRHPLTIDPQRRCPGTEYVQGNIFDEGSLDRALKDCDALIISSQFDHAPFETPSRGLTYEKMDGEGTERQIEAAKKAGVKRVIYISGAGTREGRNEKWFRAKARGEKAVRESGLQWTIFRPSWVYGPLDRSLNKFLMFARLGPVVPIIGTGKEKIQPLFVNDLAESIHQSLNNLKAFEKVFEIGGPETLTMTEIARTLLKVAGKRRLILPHPKPVMKLLALLFQFLPGRPLTPSGVDFVTMEEKVDSTILLSTLSITLTPLEAGLATYVGTKKETIAQVLQRHAA